MHALIDETQQEFLDVAKQIAQSLGIANPADIRNRELLAGWGTLAEAGLLELRSREDDQPLASGVETVLLCRALGESLVPDPYLPSGAVAIDLIARSGDPAGWLTEATEGTALYGIALSADLQSIATDADAGAILWGGNGADGYALALRPTGDGGATLLRAQASGATKLDGVSLTNDIWELGAVTWEEGGTLTAADLDRVLALALTGISADSVGTLEAALAGVVEYSGQRKAYGNHIGSFQSIQHIAADAHVAIEGARSAVYYASWAIDELSSGEALLAARVAKAKAAEIGLGVAEDVMQIYGGIGQTWEHIAHFYTRRAIFNTALLGNEDAQLDHIATARLGGN